MRIQTFHISIIIVSLSALGALRSCGKMAKTADKANDISRLRKLRAIKPAINLEQTAKTISHLNNLNNVIALAQRKDQHKIVAIDSTFDRVKPNVLNIYDSLTTDSIKYIHDLKCYIPRDYKTRYYFNRKKVLLYSNSPQFIRICKVDRVSRNLRQIWYDNGHGIKYMLRSAEHTPDMYVEENSNYALSFYLKSKKGLYQIYFQQKNVLIAEEHKKLEHLLQVIHHIHATDSLEGIN